MRYKVIGVKPIVYHFHTAVVKQSGVILCRLDKSLRPTHVLSLNGSTGQQKDHGE
jgi:hypothetical protein